MLTIRLRRSIEIRLNKLARERRQARSELASRLLEQKLSEQAEYDRCFRREVTAGMREADAGRVISHEHAMHHLER
jgi:predicted transcriptional regulator